MYFTLYKNITEASTNKTKLKKIIREKKKKQEERINQGRFTHVHPLLETLNPLKVYHQLNKFVASISVYAQDKNKRIPLDLQF